MKLSGKGAPNPNMGQQLKLSNYQWGKLMVDMLEEADI